MNPDYIRKRTDVELSNEVPQWKYFKRLVIYLVSHGKYVGIASFGTYEIIRAYMDRIMGFNQTFFNKNNIIAPIYTDRMCRRFQVPPNKNEYIYKMMKLYKIEDFNRVVLFDDLPSNIADGIGVGVLAIRISWVLLRRCIIWIRDWIIKIPQVVHPAACEHTLIQSRQVVHLKFRQSNRSFIAGICYKVGHRNWICLYIIRTGYGGSTWTCCVSYRQPWCVLALHWEYQVAWILI